ncbi:MAG: hypothetical protein PHQ60_16350 [Sideroxydans sp.]|nr:hypothetical protein [Sideroxydans sp.]
MLVKVLSPKLSVCYLDMPIGDTGIETIITYRKKWARLLVISRDPEREFEKCQERRISLDEAAAIEAALQRRREAQLDDFAWAL